MFSFKPDKILKFLCFSALVFFIIFIFLLNSFPWFLQTGFVQNRIFQSLTGQKKVSLSADEIDIDIFPKPVLRLKNLLIRSEDFAGCNLGIVKIFPDHKELMHGRLVLEKCNIINTRLTVPHRNFISGNSASNKAPDFKIVKNALRPGLIDKYIDKNKGFSILLHNFKADFAKKFDGKILIERGLKLSGNISITDFSLKTKLLKKYNFSKIIFNLETKNKDDLVKAKSINIHFNADNNKIHAVMKPAFFQFPSMRVGIEFLNDISGEKSKLEFSGTDVDIAQARKAYFDLFNKEEISENLFDIVRAGNASSIEVLFKAKTLENLFRPSNMILDGYCENGTIKIPATQMIPKQVSGRAVIKNGVLYITAEKGHIKNSTFQNGTLTIDLVHHNDYPFNGSFDIKAHIADIKAVLIESFPETLLGNELKLVNDIEGVVEGKLLLDLKTNENLSVSVNIDNVRGSADYERAPGRINLYRGKFQYRDEIIALTDSGGKIGKNYFYNFSGSYTTNDTRLIDIQSGSALIYSKDLFDWLTNFEQVRQFVPDIEISKGFLKIDSAEVKGDILEPEKLIYRISGSLDENSIKRRNGDKKLSMSNNRELKDAIYSENTLSCEFRLSDKIHDIKKINFWVSDIDILSLLNKKNTIVDVSSPIFFKDSSYQFENMTESFTGKIDLPYSISINVSMINKNYNKFLIKKFEIKDKELTNAVFGRGIDNNIDFLKFIGQISTKTLERLFKKGSRPYRELIEYTDHKNIIIKSNKENTYKISAETISFEPFIKKLISKNNIFNANKGTDFFPNKLFIVHTGSLKYKESDFKDFKADISIKKNNKGLNGNLNFKSKNGKILSLTMLSRILSVLNISTLFKGKLPDVNQEGFKYKSIIFKAKIVNNQVIIKEAVIDGHDMALVFTGSFDIVKNDLNLTCLVAPFKTIDMLIEKIPLINTMLNNTLISVPVKVSGKIEDPDVVVMHPVSIGKGLVNMMTNIIKTPVKLWDKLPVGSESKDTDN